MDVGQTCSAAILARPHWNATGIHLVRGGRYRMRASGRWRDWFIPHGADGDPSQIFYMRWFEPLRRMPHQNWFMLIGALNRDASTAFPIGCGRNYSATQDGELTCFANDVPGFYWNNRGEVDLTVTRIA